MVEDVIEVNRERQIVATPRVTAAAEATTAKTAATAPPARSTAAWSPTACHAPSHNSSLPALTWATLPISLISIRATAFRTEAPGLADAQVDCC